MHRKKPYFTVSSHITEFLFLRGLGSLSTDFHVILVRFTQFSVRSLPSGPVKGADGGPLRCVGAVVLYFRISRLVHRRAKTAKKKKEQREQKTAAARGHGGGKATGSASFGECAARFFFVFFRRCSFDRPLIAFLAPDRPLTVTADTHRPRRSCSSLAARKRPFSSIILRLHTSY